MACYVRVRKILIKVEEQIDEFGPYAYDDYEAERLIESMKKEPIMPTDNTYIIKREYSIIVC